MESENWFGNTTNMTSDQEFFFTFQEILNFSGWQICNQVLLSHRSMMLLRPRMIKTII